MITINTNNYPDKANITVVRGDTKKIEVTVAVVATAVDISDWDNFTLTIDSVREPVGTATNVAELLGTISVEEDEVGVVRFTPDNTLDAGSYYYDIQAENADGDVITLLAGKFKVLQDITK